MPSQSPGASALFLPARYNIVGAVEGRERYFVVNLLSRCADLLSPDEYQRLQAGEDDAEGSFAARGYLVDPAEEEARFRAAYLDFLEERERDEVQIFFVPWYACNFGCAYCYQDEYPSAASLPTAELLDAFFAYLDRELGGRRRYLTLFGGEPLLPGANHRAVIAGLVERAAARDLELAVVTNGYHLRDYLELLRRARIREIQVTLDGPPDVHDRRRPLKGGGASFEAVASGIDASLEAGVPINLRVVVDRGNLEALPALARIARERGWTASAGFKTQLGRNYELHHCQASADHLYDRVALWEAVYALSQRHPEILELHRPAYSVAKFLFDNSELPPPLFDSCSGCKTEWAFDASGRIYACTATVGKPGEELGRFYPTVERDEEAIAYWQDRDLFAIEGCRDCSVCLACGGGCASLARNRLGDLHAPDCRPIRRLLELGVAAYGPRDDE